MSRNLPPRRRSSPLRVEELESRQLLTTLIGLTTSDAIVSFDAARPDTLSAPVPIMGLQVGETILAIDSRAATGQVYGLGSTGRIYTIDPYNGSAAMVGNGPLPTSLSGTNFNIDFRAASSTLQIVSDAGLNLMFDVDTDTLSVGGNLAYAPGDPGAGMTPSIVAAAYNNNDTADLAGTLFEIDSKRNVLVTEDDGYGTNNPAANSGQLHTFTSSGQVVPLGVTLSGPVGLEFAAGGQPYLSTAAPGGTGSALYTLAHNGQFAPAILVGLFPQSVTIRDITSLPASPTVYAVTAANTLISFRASQPGDLFSSLAITGLQPGESIGSIAFRPATGALYGFGSTGRLYTINAASAAATPVSTAPIAPAYDGTKPSIVFPHDGLDRIRLVTQGGQNLEINPDNGAVDAVEQPLSYAPNDPGSGIPPSVVGEAYGSGSLGPGNTYQTFFGLDSGRGTMVTLPAFDTSMSGQLVTSGPLGLPITSDSGIDLAANGLYYASLTAFGSASTSFYRINPRVNLVQATQQTQPISLQDLGAIGGGAIVRSIAIAPAGSVAIDPPGQVAEAAGSATITVRRTGGQSGPLSVQAVTSDGTARAGVDYTPVNVQLNFADGETTKTFAIPVRVGSFTGGLKTLNVTLYSPAGGALNSTTLTIVGTPSSSPASLQSVSLDGQAARITDISLTFTSPVDLVAANSPANYRVVGVTADRSHRTVELPISIIFDPPGVGTFQTVSARLTLGSPLALKDFRSIQVTAKGFGPNGADSTENFTITRGAIVHYTDASGNRVILGVLGRAAKLIVVRRADGQAVSVFVEGNGKLVYGLLIPTRKSTHKTTIDRFVTGGARLRLTKSITISQVVTA